LEFSEDHRSELGEKRQPRVITVAVDSIQQEALFVLKQLKVYFNKHCLTCMMLLVLSEELITFDGFPLMCSVLLFLVTILSKVANVICGFSYCEYSVIYLFVYI